MAQKNSQIPPFQEFEVGATVILQAGAIVPDTKAPGLQNAGLAGEYSQRGRGIQ